MSPNGKGRPEAAHGTPAKKFTPNLPEATDLQVILLEAAEAAWETGRPVLVAGHVVVPDVALVEGIANGLQPPDTSYALEKDGRACYLFQAPTVGVVL